MERLEELAEKLRVNEYEAQVFESSDVATKLLLEKCRDKRVGIGDSHTIESIGLLDKLDEVALEVYDCMSDKSRERKLKSLDVDVFILSANAICEETGEIVNVDSSCNRVAVRFLGQRK